MSNDKGWYVVQAGFMMDDQYNNISFETGEPYKIDKCKNCGHQRQNSYNYDDDLWCTCSETTQKYLDMGTIKECDINMQNSFIKMITLPEKKRRELENEISSIIDVRDRITIVQKFLANRPMLRYSDLTDEQIELVIAIQNGRIRLAMETSDEFYFYYGTDLSRPYKRYIKKCLNHIQCTYTVTKQLFVRQRAFRCLTCFPNDKTMALCESCITNCHQGHDKYLPITKTKGKIKPCKLMMFCDCPCSK